MAKYRLKRAHYLPGDMYLEGDEERLAQGEAKGTVVGDGTPYPIKWPTLDMEALDEEAEEVLEKERKRLAANDASMNPIEMMAMDSYEKNYVPGSNRPRRELLPDGAPVTREA